MREIKRNKQKYEENRKRKTKKANNKIKQKANDFFFSGNDSQLNTG